MFFGSFLGFLDIFFGAFCNNCYLCTNNQNPQHMNNFTFYSPTEFCFGRGREQEVGQLCVKYGAHRVMIVYGGGSVVRSGLLDRVKASLDAVSIPYIEMGGVRPNPTDPKVYEGLALARSFKPDFMLAVGGGSVIDTAKTIAAGYYYEGDFWDFFIGKAKVGNCLPVGVVLTIPAAGSEGSGNAVITNEKTLQKLGIRQPMLLRPKFSIMNPELTITLPEWQTASGISDMMAHILERYLSNTPDVQIGDRMAEGILLAIMEEAPKVIANPNDYEARANIMWCGTIAHNDTCSLGRQEDWNSHAMEHEISAEYDVTHGAGLAVIFPAFLQYMANVHPHKVAQLAMRVLGIQPNLPEDADINNTNTWPIDEQKRVAMAGALKLKTWFHDVLHMPVSFAQLGIPKPNLELLNQRLHQNKGAVMPGYFPLDAETTMQIYKLAL